MTTLRLRPLAYTVEAWKYDEQQAINWPSWVQQACLWLRIDGELALVLDRSSGRQHIQIGEWLVKMPDDSIVWYRDSELWHEFEVV